jgi:hypothetical protein
MLKWWGSGSPLRDLPPPPRRFDSRGSACSPSTPGTQLDPPHASLDQRQPLLGPLLLLLSAILLDLLLCRRLDGRVCNPGAPRCRWCGACGGGLAMVARPLPCCCGLDVVANWMVALARLQPRQRQRRCRWPGAFLELLLWASPLWVSLFLCSYTICIGGLAIEPWPICMLLLCWWWWCDLRPISVLASSLLWHVWYIPEYAYMWLLDACYCLLASGKYLVKIC